jgi:methylthioribose-1-phosphate isomerase
MKKGLIKKVITGADRIAANGDTANKIGTYSAAVLAHYHNIPFYIAAPYSTFDFTCQTGADIPIEERSGNELKYIGSKQIAPREIQTYNPAFDVTPHELITGFITERGIITAPFKSNLNALRS